MKQVVRRLLTLFFAISILPAMGQNPKQVKPVQTAMQKFRPPKLTTTLGIRSDSAGISREEALQLINFPLRITDDKKNVYTISSYQFLYNRRSVTEDEESGKVTPVMSPTTTLFRATPISQLWRTIIAEQLKKGEELYFFDVIVKDAAGRLMFAPTLKLTIQ
jgi:hypothetical protein